jgi:hypothetical protein
MDGRFIEMDMVLGCVSLVLAVISIALGISAKSDLRKAREIYQ